MQIIDNIGIGRFGAGRVIELPDKIAVRRVNEFGEGDNRKIAAFNQPDNVLGNILRPFVDELILDVNDK